jgi:selenocysteine lyase/cysteine desulfurase
VLATCSAITARIEANPDLFHRIEFMPLLRSVRERLARFIGADTDECVLVMNASHGVNTVLRNFDWAEGDVLIASE